MGAVADGAEAVERGDTQRGGEISVGAAADRAFAESKRDWRSGWKGSAAAKMLW